jgi:alkylation response protein AidB-like acyl-CoA dehydrogenase
MELRLQTAELALRAAQSALLHSGAKGFMTTGAPQRRMREAMFFAILTPSIKHLRKELAK